MNLKIVEFFVVHSMFYGLTDFLPKGEIAALSGVLLITDVGKYGTDSCQFEECRNTSEKFVSYLETMVNAKMTQALHR